MVEHGQKWVWPIWSLDSKIDCISRKNWWNWFFACWYNFTQVKWWLKILGLGLFKNGSGQSGDGTLKLNVSEKWIDGINWYFTCWYVITKIKSWSKIFWVSMIKNGCGQSGDGTLKLNVSEEWTDGITDFLHVVTRSQTLKTDQKFVGWI